MTRKDPFLEGTFWDKFWRPIRSRALLFTPELSSQPWGANKGGKPTTILGIETQKLSRAASPKILQQHSFKP